ncbi:MAG TPA: TonB-dependent receptor, partial [Candidatus Acidoferrum sp.]|nr:TonB-dependent receptor [Candidatus Acidoferrum sp.]
MSRHLHRPLTPLAAAIAALVIGHTAAAQQAALEEITVTAQKREESLKDVPISVNVVDSSRLEAGNINKLADLTEFVPNLSIAETAVSTQLYIRGIGSGNNQGFEQSVGQYVDGVYYSRQMLMRAPYLDLSRIEVLRGPQSTLFGKNSIAGALNYTTARPTREAEVKVDWLHEFESNQDEVTGVVSGPLSDTLRGRFAFRDYREDGYIRDTFKNADEPKRDEGTYRLTLDWDATPNLDTSLKVERNNFETHGRQVEVVRDDPNQFPAGSTPLAGKNAAQILQLLGQPAMDSTLDFNRQVDAPEQSHNHIDNQTLTLNYVLGKLKLTSITGHMRYDTHEDCDCDYTPANIFTVTLGETYGQWSQELRLASPAGGAFEWMTGVYWQRSDMTSLEVLNVPYDSLIKTLALSSTNPSTRALAAVAGTKVWRDNGQSGSADAAFFQGTWKLADDVRVSVGGRFTHED